jgi:hypothetical protein
MKKKSREQEKRRENNVKRWIQVQVLSLTTLGIELLSPGMSIAMRRPVVKTSLTSLDVMAGQGLPMFRINHILSDM